MEISTNSPTSVAAAHRREAHGPIPWKRVVTCTNIWLLSGAIITMTAMSELLNSWYPTYLQEARGASQDTVGPADDAGALPGAVAAFFGGWLTDWLVRTTGSRRWGRTAQAVVGAGIAAFGIVASVWTDSTMVASAFIALVAFGVQLQLPAWWACATQVSGRHLGAIFGLMNMMGGLGRILSQQFVGSVCRLAEEPWLYRPGPVGPIALSVRGDRPCSAWSSGP